MRYMLLLCVLALSVVVPVAAQARCGLKNRLESGEFGQVTPGPDNRVRIKPYREAQFISPLPAGKAFEVIGPAICADDLTWVQVRFTTRDGFLEGWTAESDTQTYFLTPVSGTVIAGYGITAILPEGIAESAEITLQEKEPETEDNWTVPEHVQISFTGYEDNGENTSDYGEITIYRTDAIPPSDNYNMWEGSFVYVIDQMQGILKDRPNLEDFEPIYKRLPLFDVASSTNILAYRDYLAFQNGEGYHSLTASGQMIYEPTNATIEYSYIGLTNDGRYFVSVSLPINAAALPGVPVPPFDLDSEEMREYVLSNGAFFDTLEPESFTPSLTLLDELVNSLYIGD
jgi:hypothetical protein